jgi:zinc D-Ala-D-Ala carboxypeptidase
MPHSEPAPTTVYRTRIRKTRLAGLVVVLVATASLGHQLLASSSSTAPRSSPPGPPVRVVRGEHLEVSSAPRGPLGEADGAVPSGTNVFDGAIPGVAKLDPALLGALRHAANDAAAAGVSFYVDSGWRSRAYQEQLLRDAIAKYGSEAEAARWVAPPNRSAHVSGHAVDIAPSAAATAWLSAHGAAYGLCQIYANEPWHYELRLEAVEHGCPPMYADPTHDPRMQQ